MNRLKDITLLAYLVISIFYFIPEAFVRGMQFNAWGFLLFPIAGLVAR